MDMVEKRSIGGENAPKPYCKPVSEDVKNFGACDVVAEELQVIRERRKQHGLSDNPNLKTEELCGLALSGGGIRSASFSLGVMQALAFNGWLSKIDYLSTVSGGGYIGSSLTWAINSNPENFGLTDNTFPFASFPMSGEPRHQPDRTLIKDFLKDRNKDTRWSGRMLNFLRQNAEYLNPGNGLNLISLVWTAIRGASLGLLIYGALIAFIFMFAFQSGLLREACILTSLPKELRQNWFLLAALLGLGLCVVTIPIYSVFTYLFHWADGWAAYLFRRIYEITAGKLLPIFFAIFLLGIVPLAHDFIKSKCPPVVNISRARQFTISGNLSDNGKLSFNGTMNSTTAVEKPVEAFPITCGTPCPEPPPVAKDSLWANLTSEINAFFTGLCTLLVGLASGVKVFFKTKSVKPGRLPMGLLVAIGVSTLLFGIVLFAYTVAYAAVKTTGCNTWALWYTGVGFMVAIALAVFANINHVSIHRYYRDRLMETFMPDVKNVLQGKYQNASISKEANTKKLNEMVHGPYHLINTNLVLVNSAKPKLRGRGGDNFILSPLYCGSYATGWQWTGSFMRRGDKGGMTLASAMAISGAALNPSAGCGGEGVTRSPVLSALMGLLNFKLGYWVPNPKNSENIWSGHLRNPNFLLPGLWEVLFRNRLNENASFLQLSDGGHFENLALYELVRRKLKLIIVCDGGADPKFTFSDLANAMEKVRSDFGALIMINNEELKDLIPKLEKDICETACAEQAHLVATIKYADNTEGTLIYLTTTFFKGVTADLYGYKKEHPEFPDESTGDQFFDEKQFEAYRELGFQAAWKMMDYVEQTKRLWP
jgi:hypothetical protein